MGLFERFSRILMYIASMIQQTRGDKLAVNRFFCYLWQAMQTFWTAVVFVYHLLAGTVVMVGIHLEFFVCSFIWRAGWVYHACG